MKTSKSADPTTLNPSIASQPESLAKTGPLQEEELESKERDLASFLSLRESCRSFDPVGLSSRMYPDFSVATEAETLQRSSGFSWSSAGMGYRGVCSTANFSESPNVVVVCTLSDILEPRAPRRFFLSSRAAAGILRRAKKRGRILQEHLRRALESIATRPAGGKKTIITSPSTRGEEVSDGLKKEMGSSRRSKHPGEAIKEDPKSPPSSSPQASPQDLEGLEAEGLTMEQTSSMEPSKATAQEDGRRSQESTLPSSPLPKTSEENSGQARLPLNSPPGEESQEKDILALPSSTPDNSETPKAVTKSVSSLEPKSQTASPVKVREPLPTQSQASTEASGRATIPTMSVRRLTPTECETLQGFPKGWTIPGNFLCSPKEWTRPATKR